MSSRRRDERRRGRGSTVHAEFSKCCHRDRELGVRLFICTQFSNNATASESPVVGGAYCCRPSRDYAYCCTQQEFRQGVQDGNDPDPSCGHLMGGRRYHRRHVLPRVAVVVGSLLLLVIIAVLIYFCLKKKLLSRKRDGRVHGWLLSNGVVRQESGAPMSAAGMTGELITPYRQTTGVYCLPSSSHPVQYMGGSQCPLREYGPLQPAYPGRHFVSMPPSAMPRVTEIS